MSQRYIVEAIPARGVHRLPAEVSHHLARVMRARAGDTITLCDGRGTECPARLVRVRGDAVEAELLEARTTVPPAEPRIEIAFALPKGTRAEWLFEHATEVGVAVLRPLVTARADGAGKADRRERWLRIARAALAQCGRAHLPEIAAPETLAELLARTDLPDERYVSQLGARALGAAQSRRALLVVGPPGGIEPAESALLASAGFAPRGLGPATLRTETAALAGAILLLAGR
jgi:16S rRNA (uracil1498-N3)-methyltransferase